VRRSLPALLACALCAAAAAAVWLVALKTSWGVWLDERTLSGFVGLDRPKVMAAAERISARVDPPDFAVLSALLAGAALARRRLRLAVVVAGVLLAANLTTQVLKHVLPAIEATTDLGPGAGAWPSGHATAAMVAALCAVLVAPPRLRPLAAALGGLFAVAVGYSLLILEHHYPSDVVGGYLVAAAWTALGVAVLNAADARWAAGHTRAAVLRAGAALRPPAIVAGLAALAVAAVAATRLEAALEYADEHTVFVAGALALGAAAMAAAAATAAAVRGT
jgi:membrane-associated phospholipid phosphatase